MNRIWKLLLPVMIGGLLISACNTTPEATTIPPTPAPLASTIGLTLSDDTPFFQTVEAGARESADFSGDELIVADSPENDGLAQAAAVEALVERGVDALLINPTASNDETLIAAVEKAAAEGVSIFTIDRRLESEMVVAHIASDNVAGGTMAGEYLAESINRQGQVVELQGVNNTSAAIDRGMGFHEALTAYDEIEIIAQQTANFDRAEAETVFAQILAEHPQIDAVFAHNDEMVLGAITAAQHANRAEEIVFVGFDATEEAVTAVETGELTATIAQQPAEIGRLGVETVLKYFRGEEVPAYIPVDLALLTE